MLRRTQSNRNSHLLLVGMQNNTITLEDSLAVLNVLFPYDPPIVLLDIYPNELKNDVHTESHTPIFTGAFFMFNEVFK